MATTTEIVVRFHDETAAGYQPATRQQRLSAVLRFAASIEPRPLTAATAADVQAWAASTGATMRGRNIGHLHRFFAWAVAAGVADTDPTVALVHVREPASLGDTARTLGEWRRSMERRQLSPVTVTGMSNRVRLFAAWLAPRSVLDARPGDIESFLSARPGRRQTRTLPLSSDAQRGYLTALHRFYVWARRAGLTETDPTEDIDRPRRPERMPRPIATSDLAVAFERAGAQTRAVLALAAFCGLRAKEIAGVHREDVLDHLESPMLLVRSPKGRRQRTVPLHAAAADAIRRLNPPATGPVFVKLNGRQMSPHDVSDVGCGHLASLGIRATLHQLRHWYATSVYRTSLDLLLTQELLGHASPTSTRIYAAYDQSKAAGVVAALTLD